MHTQQETHDGFTFHTIKRVVENNYWKLMGQMEGQNIEHQNKLNHYDRKIIFKN